MEDHVKGGRLKRMARLALVTARTTGDLVAARAMQKLQDTDEGTVGEKLKPTAARMVEVLGEMKGVATKLGQFISLADQDTFPEEARKILNRLLSQTPQVMEPAKVRQVIARELGAAPELLFAHFDDEPFASASMGQVHGVTLKDGRDAVLKVQFPGVGKALESDLRNAAVMARGLSLAGGIFDAREYFEEISAVLRRELDYRQEVLQLRAYAQAVAPWSDIVVPEVVEEFSSERVLCMERLRGPTMLAFAEDETQDAQARFRVGAQLVKAVWGPFLSQGLIHADPHPGNYIVLEDGRLGVLDFGATRQLSLPFTVAYWRLVAATLRLESPDVYDAVSGAGFSFGEDLARTRVFLNGLRDIVERPIRQDHYDWSTCRMTIDARAYYLAEVGTAIHVRGPSESLMFYRAAVGAAGDFRMLRSRGNFRRVLHEMMLCAWEHTSKDLAEALRRAGVSVLPAPLPPVPEGEGSTSSTSSFN